MDMKEINSKQYDRKSRSKKRKGNQHRKVGISPFWGLVERMKLKSMAKLPASEYNNKGKLDFFAENGFLKITIKGKNNF